MLDLLALSARIAPQTSFPLQVQLAKNLAARERHVEQVTTHFNTLFVTPKKMREPKNISGKCQLSVTKTMLSLSSFQRKKWCHAEAVAEER
jgi:hypothetical protein